MTTSAQLHASRGNPAPVPIRVVWKDKASRLTNEFFVYVNSAEYDAWKKTKDTSTPMIDMVERWGVYIVRSVKGQPDTPSTGELECVAFVRLNICLSN